MKLTPRQTVFWARKNNFKKPRRTGTIQKALSTHNGLKQELSNRKAIGSLQTLGKQQHSSKSSDVREELSRKSH